MPGAKKTTHKQKTNQPTETPTPTPQKQKKKKHKQPKNRNQKKVQKTKIIKNTNNPSEETMAFLLEDKKEALG